MFGILTEGQNGCMAWQTCSLAGKGLSLRAELFPLYVMAVCGSLFSAMLLDMRAPKGARNAADNNVSWPYHAANLKAISDFMSNTMMACTDGAGYSYQCSYCGKGWNSKDDSSQQKPKVILHGLLSADLRVRIGLFMRIQALSKIACKHSSRCACKYNAGCCCLL